ncbi:MAG: hypothetical protein JOZ18_01645 [Chloroflexi bacterium]|nr:hypothetical protein [Chloroflexota bacterium]
MNSANRTFVKQVQVDLLALGDADLLRTIQQWMNMRDRSGPSSDEIAEDTRLALGYTRVIAKGEPLSSLPYDVSGAESEGAARWQAPSPQHLRTLLSAMDVNLFSHHVIALAFQALHTTYPEWHEGLTFNAHLANHLRRIAAKR